MALRILVVDDDPASLRALSGLLERRGFAVKTLSDSAQALAAANEFQPHVVVLDYLMPGLHGGDVAWQLASDPSLRHVRVVITSAYSTEEIRRKLPASRIPILPKPVDSEALLAVI